ncbi:uncharacterized protein BXZ73DRAFT_50052 [Epithele typhae]|uniref:uncharacterized protein n=1 Tax=Epithele typhae TaxID=378194 RepID=UPI002008B1D3|nr:uncharacterized protein BXZ73DRAFT_50052 [Epithele typhae]KAH9925354.1 hypothetical protein BXZ73DRAFT_50052 [Epithele typhae]
MSELVFLRLPRQDDDSVSNMPPQSRSAYIHYILPAEQTAIEREGLNPQDISKQRRYIGVLGGFLIEPVNETARICLSTEIESCLGSFERLVELGQFYYIHCVRRFKSAADLTPRMSSRPSLDSLAEEITPHLVTTLQNHSEAKRLALFRDGFQCILTGKFDLGMWCKYPSKFPLGAASRLAPTHCTHIIPEPVNKLTPFANPEAKLATGFSSILERFGYPDAWSELNGHKCHRLSNALTLSGEAHMLMDRLCLWFESTGEGNGWPAQITFKVRDDLGIPGILPPKEGSMDLPHPDFLALHATCCKVAHLAGAAETLEDSALHRGLAQDGSSADMLFEELYSLVDPM